jgi:pimeloyl-ACP methyl ester carboxylesterase
MLQALEQRRVVVTESEILIDRPSGVECRLVRGGDKAVVVMHDGHMSARIELGERVFRTLGYTIVVPSRHGYGSTPADAGGGRSGFVDALAGIIANAGFRSVDAVVGISAGRAAAIEMAARHPSLVNRLILENSVSSLRWSDRTEDTGCESVASRRQQIRCHERPDHSILRGVTVGPECGGQWRAACEISSGSIEHIDQVRLVPQLLPEPDLVRVSGTLAASAATELDIDPSQIVQASSW